MVLTRRDVVRMGLASAGALALGARASAAKGLHLGLVTYNVAKEWGLDTLLRLVREAGLEGVEFRTTHAHGVEPRLNDEQRSEVKQRFADSPVKLVGLGSAEDYHRPDPGAVEKAIENSGAIEMAFLQRGLEVVAFAQPPFEEAAGGLGIVVGLEADAARLEHAAHAVGVGERTVVDQAEVLAGGEGMGAVRRHRGFGRHPRMTDQVAAGKAAEGIARSHLGRRADVLVEVDRAPGGEDV